MYGFNSWVFYPRNIKTVAHYPASGAGSVPDKDQWQQMADTMQKVEDQLASIIKQLGE